MSRLTGSEAQSLMEAYNAVYAPQELTEEQIWEQVENWVNSLLEEGHDLSEYTWEEMYEEYLNEMGQRATTGQMTAPPATTSPRPTPAPAYRPGGGRQEYNQRRSGTGQMPPPATPRPSAAPYQSRFAGARDAAFSRARQIQGSPVVGPRVSAPTTPPRPAPAPTTAPGSQRPTAAPTTTTPPKLSTSVGFNAPPAGSPPPSAAYTGPKLGATPATAAAPAATPKKPSLASQTAELRAMRKASQQRTIAQGGTPATPLVQSFDLFDVVLGHLLDEGYADTEDAALAIMANMSEEWKQSILEVMVVTDADRKGGTEAAKRLQQGKPGYKPGPGYNFEKGPVQLRLPGV